MIKLYSGINGSLDNVIVIAASCGMGGPGFESLLDKRLSLFQKCPNRLWGPSRLPLSGYRGVKLLEGEVDQSR